MLNISGKERNLDMFKAMAAEAGLKFVNLHMATGTPVGLVELEKA